MNPEADRKPVKSGECWSYMFMFLCTGQKTSTCFGADLSTFKELQQSKGEVIKAWITLLKAF